MSPTGRYHVVVFAVLIVILILLLWTVIASTVAAKASFDGMAESNIVMGEATSGSDVRFASGRTDTGALYSIPADELPRCTPCKCNNESFLGGNGIGAPNFWNIGSIEETRKALADQQANYENATDYDRWNRLREGKPETFTDNKLQQLL